MSRRPDGFAEAVALFTARFTPVPNDDDESRLRSRIVEATLEIAAAEGVKGASLRRIAARTGMRTASLYSYFPGGKDELVSDALAEHLRSFYRTMAVALRADESPAENLRRLVFAHTRWTLENPIIAPAILVLERAHALHSIMTDDADNAIRELHDTYRDLLVRLLRATAAQPRDAGRLAAQLIVLCDNADLWSTPEKIGEAQEDAWLTVRQMLGRTAAIGRPRGGRGTARRRKASSRVRV
ncbi:TetR/AcrR family transcriptional regulator [Flexivirga oryzae]|uniref:AcrR family transcriptional regulator n=1 Tax=Flexivirga oryzae TaxID=1794944 RepID=A0A839N690_9MICO|nr:TetR/AcrR family transcriptional regulator [Flexivirga oryzae]MBB2891554.1 AcrR family transcriptional regulator [Flexivirga oryzae]